MGDWTFPTFPLPEGANATDTLREMTMAGFTTREITIDDVYQKRVDYELEVIKNKGYDVYFFGGV